MSRDLEPRVWFLGVWHCEEMLGRPDEGDKIPIGYADNSLFKLERMVTQNRMSLNNKIRVELIGWKRGPSVCQKGFTDEWTVAR